MAFNPQSMLGLAPPSLKPMDFSPIQQAEQYQLMQQRFEEEKKRAEEEKRYRAQQQQMEWAKAELTDQREREQAAALARAKLMESRQGGIKEMTKLQGEGNYQGALAMAPWLRSLGAGVDIQGSVDGRPRIAYDADPEKTAQEAKNKAAQEATALAIAKNSRDPRLDVADAAWGKGPESIEESAARMDTIGYPTDEQTPIDEGPGIGSSASIPEAAQQYFQQQKTGGTEAPLSPEVNAATGIDPNEDIGAEQTVARLAPGGHVLNQQAPDLTGSVPNNVVDSSAIHDQTLRRLHPTLAALSRSLPDVTGDGALQKQAEGVAGGIEESDLPTDKALEGYNREVSPIVQATDAKLMADATLGRFDAEQARKDQEREDKMLDNNPEKQEEQRGKGHDRVLHSMAQAKSATILQNARQVGNLEEALTNDTGLDDPSVAHQLAKWTDGGRVSDRDVAQFSGESAMSLLQRVEQFGWKTVYGGFDQAQKEALGSMVARLAKEDHDTGVQFLEGALSSAEKSNKWHREGQLDELETQFPDGWVQEARQNITKRKGSAAAPAQAPGGGAAAPSSQLTDVAKELGVDPAELTHVVGKESGGKSSSLNDSGHSGLLQMGKEEIAAAAQEAKLPALGPEEFSKLSAEQQMPYIRARLKLVNVKPGDDAATIGYKNALPGFAQKNLPDDFVVAKPDQNPKSLWSQNAPWRGPDGNITIGSVKAYYRRQGKGAGAKSAAVTAKTDKDREALADLGLAGGM